MYEGLGIRFKKERKKLTPKAIILIVVAALVVVAAVGYLAFWNSRIHAVFDKFYGGDTLTLDHAGAAAKPASGYKVFVLKPDINSFTGYVSIEQTEGPVSVWFNPNALTDELVDWNIVFELEPSEDNDGITAGFRLDKDRRAYEYPLGNSGFTNGKSDEGKTPQEYADENRAGIKKMFDEIERRWGYKFPPEMILPE
jgi:hypothetical protein